MGVRKFVSLLQRFVLQSVFLLCRQKGVRMGAKVCHELGQPVRTVWVEHAKNKSTLKIIARWFVRLVLAAPIMWKTGSREKCEEINFLVGNVEDGAMEACKKSLPKVDFLSAMLGHGRWAMFSKFCSVLSSTSRPVWINETSSMNYDDVESSLYHLPHEFSTDGIQIVFSSSLDSIMYYIRP